MELADLAPDEELAMELAELAPDEEPTRERRSAEPMRTRTLAELYVKQGFVDKALEVLRHLRSANPSATDLDERIAQLERGEGASQPAATTAEPSAQDAEDGLEPEEEVETLARDLAESGHEGHDVDTPFAWAPAESEGGDEDRGGDGIGAYFDRLLGWEPRERS